MVDELLQVWIDEHFGGNNLAVFDFLSKLSTILEGASFYNDVEAIRELAQYFKTAGEADTVYKLFGTALDNDDYENAKVAYGKMAGLVPISHYVLKMMRIQMAPLEAVKNRDK